MNEECERWASIGDRKAVGLPLSEAEERFGAEHISTCGLCQREAKLWRVMESRGRGSPLNAEATRTAVDRILERHATEAPVRGQATVAGGERPLGRLLRLSRGAGAKTAIATVSALALAASVALLLRNGKTAGPEPLAARARLSLVSGYAELEGLPARAGDPFRSGQTIHAEGSLCLDIEPDVRACLEAGSEARFADAAFAHRVIELRKGRLNASLGHQPEGTSFSVSTPKGVVTAVGTSFSVDVRDDTGPVVLRVQSGVVAVQVPGKAGLRVGALEQNVLGTAVVARVSAAEDEPLAELRHAPQVWDKADVAVVEVRTQPDGAPIDLDGMTVGLSPLSACLPAGDHHVTVRWPNGTTSNQTVHLSPGDRVTRDLSPAVAPLPPPFSKGEAAAPAPSAVRSAMAVPQTLEPEPRTADALLTRARALRGEGRFREAAEAYGQLEAGYATSPEALASLVSLGDLQLSHLSDPSSALRAFDAYLAKGGVLAEEALYGRIGALSALRQEDQERQTIEVFLTRYPASLHAEVLRSRLASAHGDASL